MVILFVGLQLGCEVYTIWHLVIDRNQPLLAIGILLNDFFLASSSLQILGPVQLICRVRFLSADYFVRNSGSDREDIDFVVRVIDGFYQTLLLLINDFHDIQKLLLIALSQNLSQVLLLLCAQSLHNHVLNGL